MGLLQFIATVISILLDLVMTTMMIRVLLSFFIDGEGNSFFAFIFFVTEIFVTPVRFILAKLHLFEDTPIDIAFTLAYILLALTRMMLPVI